MLETPPPVLLISYIFMEMGGVYTLTRAASLTNYGTAKPSNYGAASEEGKRGGPVQ